MSTFLELCQLLTVRSGAIGAAPASVTGQTGRQAKCVDWIMNSWVLIQNLHANWAFNRAEFDSTLAVDTTTYSAASFNISARFGEWIGDYDNYRPTTLYDPDIGPADEGSLRLITWETWRSYYGRGVHEANRPTDYCLAPDQSLRVGVKPNKAYVIRGEYRKSPQILSANDDIPEMPVRFHDVIVWRAVILIAEHDEAPNALQLARTKYGEMISQMERDLLPAFSVRGERPLA